MTGALWNGGRRIICTVRAVVPAIPVHTSSTMGEPSTVVSLAQSKSNLPAGVISYAQSAVFLCMNM